MPIAERRADVVWEGTLFEGAGQLSTGSGIIQNLPVTWAARTERPNGKTSPEELIAAAQASCYAMALSNTLAEQSTPPTVLNVTAVCAADMVDGGLKVTTMDISVRGRVSGLDEAGFQAAAEAAGKSCPVSNALRNNVEITITAQLEQE
jgi:lipoyl-dependent peroxiredoxin